MLPEDGITLILNGDVPLIEEIYDPMTEKVQAAAPMPEGRYLHSAALMDDGRVLVAGGFRGNTEAETVDLYDPERNRWVEIDGPSAVRGGYVAIVPNTEGAWVLTAEGVRRGGLCDVSLAAGTGGR